MLWSPIASSIIKLAKQLFHLETNNGEDLLYCIDLFDRNEITKKADAIISKPAKLEKMEEKDWGKLRKTLGTTRWHTDISIFNHIPNECLK